MDADVSGSLAKPSGTVPPVLLLVFNRPDTTRALIHALSKVRPPHIYVAADGPRDSIPSDASRCEEARRIATDISWPCTVHTLFSNVNLGVDPAVEKAISWFFSEVEEGIILEDDCIPHPDFFTFVSEMLDRYKNDNRIMMVSGDNFQDGRVRGDGDYYFSSYGNTWGWATWRRAWRAYDTKLSLLPEFIAHARIAGVFDHTDEQAHWLRYLKKLHAGTRTPWDTKWMFALWGRAGLSVVPNKNLVTNIGFGDDATHTKGNKEREVGARALMPPYTPPGEVAPNREADRYLFETIYRVTFLDKVRYILRIFYEKAHAQVAAITH